MPCWTTSIFSVRMTFSESWHPRWRRWVWCAGCGPNARSNHGTGQTCDPSHFSASILMLPPGQSLCQIRQPLWNQSNYIATSSSYRFQFFNKNNQFMYYKSQVTVDMQSHRPFISEFDKVSPAKSMEKSPNTFIRIIINQSEQTKHKTTLNRCT